jgi:DNA-directed RNA polymerase subunit RPC12/RpoP
MKSLMIRCPNCNYGHGWNPETRENERSERGDFYSFPIEIVRSQFMDEDRRQVYGCPNCKILFIA